MLACLFGQLRKVRRSCHTRPVELLAYVSEHPLLAVGAMLLVGYALGKLGEMVHLPEITGFIVAGLVIGPAVSGVVDSATARDLVVLTEIALAFIAFTVGGALHRSTILRVGRSVFMMSLGHLVTSFTVVSLSLMAAGINRAVAVLMGVIAGATSPGTTVAVVQREQAHGPFVEHLFGVVAVVNALTIMLFGVVFEFAPLMMGVGLETAPLARFGASVLEILLSVTLGAASGVGIHLATRTERARPSQIIIMTIGFLFFSTSLSVSLGFSPLLLNMAAGAAFVNLSTRSEAVFRTLEPLTPPIYALFFVLAGTKFQPLAFIGGPLVLFGLLYIVARIFSVYSGVRLAAHLAGVEAGIGRNLGFCLVPQAGVALGLVLLLEGAPILGQLPPLAVATLLQAVNIVLMAIFVKEIVGPPLSAYAVRRGVRQTAASVRVNSSRTSA